jgi:hypothetical protein
MTSDIVKIPKDELEKLIRGIVKEELNKIHEVSEDEQKELEKLYGESLTKEDYSREDCIRL